MRRAGTTLEQYDLDAQAALSRTCVAKTAELATEPDGKIEPFGIAILPVDNILPRKQTPTCQPFKASADGLVRYGLYPDLIQLDISAQ
ncbi:hypothetical protein D3C78_1673610 [compost metagenome]